VGFGVGLFWLALAFVFFSGGGLVVTIRFDYVAVITRPPLFFGHDYFRAPLLNAPLYGLVSFLFMWVRRKRGHRSH
jgi:hypothetical protein